MADDWDDEDEVHTSDGKPRPNDQYDVTAAELQQFVERLNQIEGEIADRRDDKKELFAELKARGFDKKAFEVAVKVLKLCEDKSKVDAKLELRQVARIYLTALGQEDFEELL